MYRLIVVSVLIAGSQFFSSFVRAQATPSNQSPALVAAKKDDWFMGRFNANREKLKDGPYDLVFDGDSITDLWQTTGKDVWAQHYGSRKALDLGVGGDQVQNLLWRVQNGELEGQDPKLIVLLVGTNNLMQDPKDVAGGIRLVLNEYEQRCPDAHILLLGLFPRDPKDINGSARSWIRNVNSLIAPYDDGKRVTYMDIGAKFLQPDGTLTADIMPDFLHPSAKGYEIWADAIQAAVDKYQ
jgi:lysophospholipase L1-like esterase